MKTLRIFGHVSSLALASLVAFDLVSCAGMDATTGPVLLQAGASLATTGALQYGVRPEQQPAAARYAYTAAAALRSLAGGTAPSVEQVQATIRAFGGSGNVSPFIAQLATALGAVYAAEFPRLQTAGSAQVLTTMERLAAGVEQAAAAYLPPGTASIAAPRVEILPAVLRFSPSADELPASDNADDADEPPLPERV